MKNSWLSVVVSLVVIAVVAVGLYYYNQREISNLETQISELSSVEQPVPEDLTTDWEVYVDSLAGFKLKYPNGWHASYQAGMLQIANFDSQLLEGRGGGFEEEQMKIYLTIEDNKKGKTAEELFEKGIDESLVELDEKETVNVAGKQATKFVYSSSVGGGISVYIPGTGDQFIVMGGGPNIDYTEDTLLRILETFELVE